MVPFADPEAAGFPFDDLGVVEEAVEDLPEKDEGHQHEVDQGQYHDSGFQAISQVGLFRYFFVVFLQVPLVKGRPWTLEIDMNLHMSGV